jgi:hypothetical protein
VKHWVEAAEKFPGVPEDDMLRKTINESSEPVVGRLGRCESAQRGQLVKEAVGKDAAIVQWDIVRGLVRVNDAGAKEIGKVLGERDSASVDPVDALAAACQLSDDAVLVFANAQRLWNDAQAAQAIWNLRDVFKANGRTLTLLTTPCAVLPNELTQDVLLLDEPLPAVEDLTPHFGRHDCGGGGSIRRSR